jgi:hypothetical protein
MDALVAFSHARLLRDFIPIDVSESQTAGILGQVHSLLTRSNENYVTRVVDK